VDQDPCPASKPACSNGACAVATLSGGIVTVSDGVLSTSTVRLVEHGLEYTQTTCGTVGTQKVCVTGGIRP
jgi:predicted transcriptional regulator